MCYELIPPALPEPAELLRQLNQGLELCNGAFSSCGKALRGSGSPKEGLFFTRCYRAGIDEQDVRDLLGNLEESGFDSIITFRQRLEIAWRIAWQSAQKRNKSYYGFKLNIPSVENAFKFFPNSKLIYILRDPRDVVASHIQRKFDRTVEEICRAWSNYLQTFERFQKDSPSFGLIVRYEDIVSNPGNILPEMFNFLELPLEDSVYAFYKSKAGIHSYGHPNAENLKKDFFTTSIGRWKDELSPDQAREIESLCESLMAGRNYQ